MPTPEQLAQLPTSPEVTPIQSPEQAVNAEQLAVDHQGQTVSPATPPIVPSPTTMPVQQQPVAATDDVATPVVASDKDVIEKIWIDKVKKVISSTSGDPYAQQREISLLMADYVLKRYGRKIGKAEE
jgi:hypothetical protein